MSSTKNTAFPRIARTLVLPVALLIMISGCATNIHPKSDQNPPPKQNFAAFNQFQLLPLKTSNAEAAEQTSAITKIQEQLNERLQTRLQQLNAKRTSAPVRTLVIEPTIEELKFVGGGKRFFAGAMAGSSAVIMKAKFTEKETAEEIANPEFYAKAAAMSGAWSFGGADNAMLSRIANSLAAYVFKNYKQATGGPVMPIEEEASSISTD